MIEIRELIIRATVEDSPRNDGGRAGRVVNKDGGDTKGVSNDVIDTVLAIIKEKQER